MGWRNIASIFLGFTLWWFLFFAVGIGFGLLWPEYREAARLMFQEGDLSLFRTPLLLLNLLLFVAIGLATGSVSALVGTNRTPAIVLVSLFFVFMAINHFFREWDQLPPWYNLIVPFIAAGSIYAGSRLPPRARL